MYYSMNPRKIKDLFVEPVVPVLRFNVFFLGKNTNKKKQNRGQTKSFHENNASERILKNKEIKDEYF